MSLWAEEGKIRVYHFTFFHWPERNRGRWEGHEGDKAWKAKGEMA